MPRVRFQIRLCLGEVRGNFYSCATTWEYPKCFFVATSAESIIFFLLFFFCIVSKEKCRWGHPVWNEAGASKLRRVPSQPFFEGSEKSNSSAHATISMSAASALAYLDMCAAVHICGIWEVNPETNSKKNSVRHHLQVITETAHTLRWFRKKKSHATLSTIPIKLESSPLKTWTYHQKLQWTFHSAWTRFHTFREKQRAHEISEHNYTET